MSKNNTRTNFVAIIEESQEIPIITLNQRDVQRSHESLAPSQVARRRRLSTHSGSVYVPDMNTATYRNENLDGSRAVPRSPRRVNWNLPKQSSKLSIDNRSLSKEPSILEEEEEDQEIIIDSTHVDPYLMALGEASFKYRIFLFELVCHLFMPIIVPFFLFTEEGRTYLYNRSFIGLQGAFFVQWIIFAAMILIHVLYFVFEPKNIPYYEIILFDVIFFIRNTVVAVKFGYVSKLEHDEMKKIRETQQIRNDRQVITGWSNPSDNSIETQILLASARQQVDLTMAFFDVYAKNDDNVPIRQAATINPSESKEDSKVASDLAKEIQKSATMDDETSAKPPSTNAEQLTKAATESPEKGRYSAWIIAKSLIKSSQLIKYDGRVVVALTTLHCISPLVFRAIDGQPITGEYSWPAVVISVLMFLLSFFLMMTNFSFLLIASMDISRRKFLMKRLNAFLIDGYIQDPAQVAVLSGSENLIRLDMNMPNNIIAWWYLKLVMQNYGLQYYKRITAYTSIFAVFSFALIVILLIQAFVNANPNKNIVFLVILNVTTALIAVSFVVSNGGKINRIRKIHARTIINRSLDIESIIMKHQELSETRKRSKPLPQYLSQSKQILQIMLQAINSDNELLIIKLLGFTASTDLIQYIGALLIAGLASAVKLIFNFSFAL